MELLDFIITNWQIIVAIFGAISYGTWIKFQVKQLIEFRKEDKGRIETLENRVDLIEKKLITDVSDLKLSVKAIEVLLQEHLRRDK